MPDDNQDKGTDTDNATGEDNGQGQDQGGAANTDTGDTKDKSKEKTFTESELDRRLQAGIAKALETQKAKMIEEQDTIIKAKEEEAEKQRLEEKGEYKKLHEDAQAKLDALLAEKAAHEHADAVRAVLKKAELSELADILLRPRDDVDSIEATATEIKTMIEARVSADVGEKLKTGKRPTGSGGTAPPANADKPSEWTTPQLEEFLKTHTSDEHRALVEAEAEAKVRGSS